MTSTVPDPVIGYRAMDKARVMLVEDDRRLAELVVEFLEQNDIEVEWHDRGDSAVESFHADIDLVILDLMIPGMDGLSVCRELRQHHQVPIMMLTAKGGDIDQVLGLELGADDYVVKPVEPRVLLARVRALLRRTGDNPGGNGVQQHGRLSIHPSAQRVTLDGETVPLTTQEFDLLRLLAARPGKVQSREEIYRKLRGIEYDGLDRSVDVCVSHLRKKLGDDDQQALIKTVWGKGYLFTGATEA